MKASNKLMASGDEPSGRILWCGCVLGNTDLQQGRAGELPAQLRGEESLQPRPPADGNSGKAFSEGGRSRARDQAFVTHQVPKRRKANPPGNGERRTTERERRGRAHGR